MVDGLWMVDGGKRIREKRFNLLNHSTLSVRRFFFEMKCENFLIAFKIDFKFGIFANFGSNPNR